MAWALGQRSRASRARPRCTISEGSMAVMFSPLNSTEPLRGSMMPEMVFSVVVLPAPFDPKMVAIWPRCTFRLTPRMARMGP